MIATSTRHSHPQETKLFDEFCAFLDQVDEPLGFEAGDANLYRYVGNSPTNATDPTGKALVWRPPTHPRPGWLPGWVPWPYDDPVHKMSFDPSDVCCPLMSLGARGAKTAEVIIQEECKGSIRRVFPGELLHETLNKIWEMAKGGNSNARKAKKLLCESRFKK
jgi:hypothetical protein